MSHSEKSAGSHSAPDQGSEASTERAHMLGVLSEVAYGCTALRELLRIASSDETGFVLAAAADLVSRLGFIADRASAALGEGHSARSADEWLLSPDCQAAIAGLVGASAALVSSVPRLAPVVAKGAQ